MTGTAAEVSETASKTSGETNSESTQRREAASQSYEASEASRADLRDVEQALQESKGQRDQRIRSLFDRFDTEKSGYLDQKLIKDGFQTFSIPYQYKYAADLLNVCDSNRDGQVDFDEFKKYMDAKELELYQMFREIDVKHNGVLQLEELGEALLRAGTVFFVLRSYCLSVYGILPYLLSEIAAIQEFERIPGGSHNLRMQ